MSDAQLVSSSSRGAVLRRAAIIASIFGFIGGLLALQVPLCPMARYVGKPCPGCGLTRATYAWLELDPLAALRFHPLSFIISPLFVFLVTVGSFNYIRRGSMWPGREPRWVFPAAGALYVAMIGVWLARFLGAFGGPVPV